MAKRRRAMSRSCGCVSGVIGRIRAVYGRLGLLMVVTVFCSGLWTVFLLTLQLFPDVTANALMRTSTLDEGMFWQLPKAPPSVIVVGTCCLLMICALYFHMVYVMLRLPTTGLVLHSVVAVHPVQHHHAPANAVPPPQPMSRRRRSVQAIAKRVPPSLKRRWTTTTVFYADLVNQTGRYRKIWNLVLEIPEVVFQTLTLFQYLSDGVQQELVYAYVSLMLLNCILCFYFIQIAWRKPAFDEIVADALLDVVFTIIFPALVLFYSVATFSGDLESIKIQLKFFPPQRFDRGALMYADATQVANFLSGFQSLRMMSGWDVALRVPFNIMTCRRWQQIIMTYRNRFKRDLGAATTRSVRPDNAQGTSDTAQKESRRWHRHIRRVVPRPFGWIFLTFGVTVTVFTCLGVQQTTKNCSAYAPCVQHAYWWNIQGRSDLCPCLTYIDRVVAPNTTVWNDDNDVDPQMLINVSKAGLLRRLELVNRPIGRSFPKEMIACTDLKQIVLVYSGLSIFPPWASTTFANLQVLHIEGKPRSMNLRDLPPDLFLRMTQLHTLQLIQHHGLERLPDFGGLTHLTKLYLANLENVAELPPFTSLHNLEEFGLSYMSKLTHLPDLTPLDKNTIKKIEISRTSLCCSGYLNGQPCNITHPDCAPTVEDDDLQSRCLSPVPTLSITILDDNNTNDTNGVILIGRLASSSDSAQGSAAQSGLVTVAVVSRVLSDGSDWRQLQISNASMALLEPYIASNDVCNLNASLAAAAADEAQATSSILGASMVVRDECHGMRFARCSKGICSSLDMSQVQCINSQAVIDMRKAQIAQGAQCDPHVEDWLGCV